MTENQLPPVAKSIFIECKKCEAERYHRVLAHTSETSARVECEVCHSKKKYTLPKAKPASKSSSSKTVTRKKSETASSRKLSHENEYQQMLEAQSNSDVNKYTMKTKYVVQNKIEHPKFGVGIIKTVFGDKIEVVFSDEVRMLVHNRG
jgi:hypothetical protein